MNVRWFIAVICKKSFEGFFSSLLGVECSCGGFRRIGIEQEFRATKVAGSCAHPGFCARTQAFAAFSGSVPSFIAENRAAREGGHRTAGRFALRGPESSGHARILPE